MSVSIEALSGPFHGEKYEFDSDKEEIVFGRGEGVDVPLDPEDLSLSRSHVTLEFTNDRDVCYGSGPDVNFRYFEVRF